MARRGPRPAHGYNRIDGGPEGRIEEDTVKCNHCQAIGFIQSDKSALWPQFAQAPQEQFTCRQCYEPICPRCANLPCRHFEKWLEKVESKAGLYRLILERMEERAYKLMGR